MPPVLWRCYLYLLVDQETQQDPVVLEIQHLLSVQVLQVHLSHLADHQGPIRNIEKRHQVREYQIFPA